MSSLGLVTSTPVKGSKKSKVGRTPLPKKQPRFVRVIFNSEDVTPRAILPIEYKNAKERSVELNDEAPPSQSGIHLGTMYGSKCKIKTSQMDSPRKSSQNLYTTYMSTQLELNTDVRESFNTEVGSLETPFTRASRISTNFDRDTVPMPPYINLIIHETETIIIFDLPSSSEEKNSEAGKEVEEDNKLYEHLTQGKGKNRKVVDACVQTISVLIKNQLTEAPANKQVVGESYVSLWDMYDTYDDLQNKTEVSSVTSLTSEEKHSALVKEDEDLIILSKNKRYMESVCIMQRILANNVFGEQQKRFRGLSDPSPFRENIEFNYRLNFLWTFANEDTVGKCASAICIHKVNKDIIAVGYGKFHYDDEIPGLVLIWNIKNPVQPERTYHFETPVTSVDFSEQYLNHLAVGFYDGSIVVMDISSRDVLILGECDREVSKLYEPIWQLSFYTDCDYYKGREFLMATCQNGLISKFRVSSQTVKMHHYLMMRVTTAEGKLKGIQRLRKCQSKTVSLSRHSPALVYTPHPVDHNIYYIGTSEGVVHKCSKNYYHQHLDLFLAHDGPMYAMEFSPFCNKLFLTCGDDFSMRLWAYGISEPLFEMKKRWAGVQGVAWSPSHSTIIASICGKEIFIWDIQRKTYDVQSSVISPSKARNTLVKFTDDGRCLLVGDIEGNVHVFSLEDMPFVAYFQENLLTQSIKRNLNTRPDLLNRVEKLNGLNFET